MKNPELLSCSIIQLICELPFLLNGLNCIALLYVSVIKRKESSKLADKFDYVRMDFGRIVNASCLLVSIVLDRKKVLSNILSNLALSRPLSHH